MDFNPSSKALIFFKTAVSTDIQQDNSFTLSLDITTIPLIYFNMRKAFKQYFYLDTIFLSLIFVQFFFLINIHTYSYETFNFILTSM